MKGGVLHCSGSSLFLKHLFSAGYVLTLTTERPSSDLVVATLRAALEPHFERVGVARASGYEVAFAVPLTAKGDGGLSSVLSKLQSIRAELGVRELALSLTTLEDVFLKTADEEEERAADSADSVADHPHSTVIHRTRFGWLTI